MVRVLALDGGTAVVNVVANGAGLSKSIASATEKGISQAQGPIAAAGKKLTGFLTSPLTLIGAGAVAVVAKLGFEFETAFAKIASVSNSSAKEIAVWRDQVLSLSGKTAQAPQELADALFFLASAGLKAGEPMQVLEASAKASAVGLGQTADIARLTANVLNAYAKSGITAAQVTDQLVAAVREGTANADEFTTAIGRLLPIAARAGVGFDQLVGSLAALSNIGLDVNEGVTALRGLLQSIVAPTAQSVKALKELHITTDQLRATLSEQGLPGALNLLEKASGGNIDVLRQLIPNIRALTGELGLTGQNADKVALIMIATAHATGSLDKAFAQTAKGPAFQFSKAVNDIRVAGTELGTAVLPAVTKAVELISPLLKFAAKNALALLAAFVAFKVVKVLPDLMLKLGASLLNLGSVGQSAGTGLIAAGTAMTGLTAATVGATAGIGLLALAISSSQFSAKIGEAIAPAIQSATDIAQAVELAARTGLTFQESLGKIHEAADKAAKSLGPVSGIVDNLTTHLDKAGHQVANFAGLTNKELKKLRQDTMKNFADVGGAITDTGATFTLTAAEVIKGVQRIATAQQRMAKDLQKLDDIPIGDKLKARLIALGPEAVDGFVRGTAKQRGAIRQGLRAFDTAANDTNKAVKDILSKGGTIAGKGLADGTVIGINAGSPALLARAHQLGLDTVAALNAGLGNASPSKKGKKAGQDLIDGLIQGMNSRFRKVQDALRALVPLMQKALGIGAADQARAFLDSLDALDKRFEKLKTKIGNFKSAIRGAFTDAADLIGTIGASLEQFRTDQQQFLTDQAAFLAGDQTGTAPTAPTSPDLQALIAAQVAQAQQLAKLLKQLQAGGLSTANLAQIAGQGTAGIPIAQALLDNPELIQQLNDAQQQIADITKATADKMTAAAFGDKVQRLSDQLQHLLERLQTFIQGLGLTTDALKKEEQAFIDALRKLNNAMAGIGVPGGTPNEGNNRPGGNGGNNITVIVNAGAGADGNLVGAQIRDELLKLGRRNNGTGLN